MTRVMTRMGEMILDGNPGIITDKIIEAFKPEYEKRCARLHLDVPKTKEEWIIAYKHMISNKLVTKMGVLEESDDLEDLDRDAFTSWVKEHRKAYGNGPKNEADWVLVYKRAMAKEYGNRFYGIDERFS